MIYNFYIMDKVMQFLKKVNSDDYQINDFSDEDGEYLDCYIFEDFDNYSQSDEFMKEMYKLVDKYIVHFINQEDQFAFLTCIDEDMIKYILETYGKQVNDVISFFICLADGPENLIFIMEMLVKHNIVINKISIDENLEEIETYIKRNYFDNVTNEQVRKYLKQYEL